MKHLVALDAQLGRAVREQRLADAIGFRQPLQAHAARQPDQLDADQVALAVVVEVPQIAELATGRDLRLLEAQIEDVAHIVDADFDGVRHTGHPPSVHLHDTWPALARTLTPESLSGLLACSGKLGWAASGVSNVTSRLTLFDDVERSDHSPASRREASFDFMNRSAWPAYHNIRAVLEQWFERYPEESKKDLRSRLRKRDENHDSAFFELFLHQLFRSLGLSPVVHPRTRAGRGRPDFSITGGTGDAWYVEANVTGPTTRFATDPLEDEILDAIDSLAAEKPTRIALRAATNGKLHQSVSSRRIKKMVRQWVDEIDPASIGPSHTHSNPELHIPCNGWTLTLTAYHVLSSPSNWFIHTGPMKGGWRNDGEALRKNILEKAKQHGELEHPLIIAMNTQNGFQDREDELSALFGSEQITWLGDGRGNFMPPRVSRKPDSVWRTPSGSRYARLHGVLFFRGAFPSNVHDVVSHLYVNPYIEAAVPEELLRLGSARVRDGEMHYEAGMPLGEPLELPADWPGERTPPR